MVNRPAHSGEINEFDRPWLAQAKGRRRGNRFLIYVGFSEGLFNQIRTEAARREWTMAHMVRHLCEASIEGIE